MGEVCTNLRFWEQLLVKTMHLIVANAPFLCMCRTGSKNNLWNVAGKLRVNVMHPAPSHTTLPTLQLAKQISTPVTQIRAGVAMHLARTGVVQSDQSEMEVVRRPAEDWLALLEGASATKRPGTSSFVERVPAIPAENVQAAKQLEA